MKLFKHEGDKFIFDLGQRERALWQAVLGHYPLLPASHHKLTRATDAGVDPSDQKLLEEAMSALKREHQSRVKEFLKNQGRFVAQGSGYRLTLSRQDLDWLLQVLNDVRVGSWMKLGCPDPDEGKLPALTDANAPFLFLMELSGQFECELLEALDGLA